MFRFTPLLVVLIVLLIYLSNILGRGYTLYNSSWDSPKIINNILTKDECNYIISTADSLFSRSTVIGNKIDQTRTSETAWISKTDPVAQKIFQKVSELTGKSIDNCEKLQVVRYKPGTFYKGHHDSCCDSTKECKDFERKNGQRIATLLIYLNDDFTEGETHFPNYNNMKFKPEPGSAIFFRPLGNRESKCHPKAYHAGLPVSTGVKYVCNAWVREIPFEKNII